MIIGKTTSVTNLIPQRDQGAVIQSVSYQRQYRVHYGVQSATFVRTVFPGEASGVYLRNSPISTWSGSQLTSSSVNANRSSPPRPYPPGNASAYYSGSNQRIVANNNTYCPTCSR